jgi:predicted RNA-binding Zn-ribbon protein involved in translation (DUF1610 family)
MRGWLVGRCAQCLETLPDGAFFEQDGRLYCEVDYLLLFGDRCARCGEAVVGRCLNALDLKWHPDHFTCDECGQTLAGSSFFKRLGRPFCKPCNEKLKQRGTPPHLPPPLSPPVAASATVCRCLPHDPPLSLSLYAEAELAKNVCMRCKKPIADKTELLILQKEKFHAYHFSCTSCSKPLTSDCKDLDGKLYCPPCYNKGALRAPAHPKAGDLGRVCARAVSVLGVYMCTCARWCVAAGTRGGLTVLRAAWDSDGGHVCQLPPSDRRPQRHRPRQAVPSRGARPLLLAHVCLSI